MNSGPAVTQSKWHFPTKMSSDGVCTPTSLALPAFTHFLAELYELCVKSRFGTSSMFWGKFYKYSVVPKIQCCDRAFLLLSKFVNHLISYEMLVV